tara:strand:- start:35215 stop:36063 length:849 start_codon:yes stop_codon:yes gene_type:complete
MAIISSNKISVKYSITALLIFCSFTVFCQDLYKGKLIDNKTKEPLPWVNVGIVGKNVGTVSNDFGDFNIQLHKKFNLDTLSISMIGYKSLKFRVDDFRDRMRKNPVFQMEEESIQLDEVVISNVLKKEVILGNTEFTNTMVLGFESNELGNEIGTTIKVEDGPVDIKAVNIRIYKNKLKRFKIRVNIYDLKDGKPNKNILNENIIIEWKKKRGLFRIDLSQYNIIAENDVFVSLEWIQNSAKENLYFSTTPEGSKTFIRDTSHANWVEAQNVSLGLNISVEY